MVFLGVLTASTCAAYEVVECPRADSPSLEVLRPGKTAVLQVETHGMEMVAFDVEVMICNFDATDSSLAVFGSGGETKLMTVWPPLTGRKNITIELPFPAGETMVCSLATSAACNVRY